MTDKLSAPAPAVSGQTPTPRMADDPLLKDLWIASEGCEFHADALDDSDLPSQAESWRDAAKRIRAWQTDHSLLSDDYAQLTIDNDKLRASLAERAQEIERLKASAELSAIEFFKSCENVFDLTARAEAAEAALTEIVNLSIADCGCRDYNCAQSIARAAIATAEAR